MGKWRERTIAWPKGTLSISVTKPSLPFNSIYHSKPLPSKNKEKKLGKIWRIVSLRDRWDNNKKQQQWQPKRRNQEIYARHLWLLFLYSSRKGWKTEKSLQKTHWSKETKIGIRMGWRYRTWRWMDLRKCPDFWLGLWEAIPGNNSKLGQILMLNHLNLCLDKDRSKISSFKKQKYIVTRGRKH